MQMAYVPADLDAALHFWTRTIGAGPFFAINHIKLDRTSISRRTSRNRFLDHAWLLGRYADRAHPPAQRRSFDFQSLAR